MLTILITLSLFYVGFTQTFAEPKDIKNFSNAWALSLTSGQYSTGYVNDFYQIEIGYTNHEFDFNDIESPYIFNNDTVGKVHLQSIYTQVDLPISIQLGFKFGLPLNKNELNASTNIYGFLGKWQLSRLFYDDYPAISVLFQKDFLKLNSTHDLSVFAVHGIMSQKLWVISLNAGLTYTKTDLTFNGTDSTERQFLYKAGAMIDLTYIKLFAEKTFHTYKNNITFGASIVF